MKCRSTFQKIYNFEDFVILDEIDIIFESIHLIFSSLYGSRATNKMHLIQNLKEDSKCIYIISKCLQYYLL